MSHRTAKKKKPSTNAEIMILPDATDMVQTMFGKNVLNSFVVYRYLKTRSLDGLLTYLKS
jgi:hypothetical protein